MTTLSAISYLKLTNPVHKGFVLLYNESYG